MRAGLRQDAAPPLPANHEHDRQALETLVVDNADLERLESLIAQFNIFEAVGVERQELRHSDFLAFLLDPRQSHGLGDSFLRRLLQKALLTARTTSAAISPIDLDGWRLDHTVVLREWRNIDLLATDEPHHLAVIIENKIGSAEHSDQLGRYLDLVTAQYPGWRILALYLTPEGESPSEAAYLPVDYGVVCDTVEAITESRRPTLDPAVDALLTHYARMLRRHVVSDSDIAELCRRIYERHKRAIDLIIEHRPDQQAAMRAFVEALIQATPGLVLDPSSKQYIRFAPAVWETPALLQGEGWSGTSRMLLFEFTNLPQQLDLRLVVGPGPAAIRRQLVDLARASGSPFSATRRETAKWTTIFSQRFLRASDYDGATQAEIEGRIQDRWTRFVEEELPQIVATIPGRGFTVPAGMERG